MATVTVENKGYNVRVDEEALVAGLAKYGWGNAGRHLLTTRNIDKLRTEPELAEAFAKFPTEAQAQGIFNLRTEAGGKWTFGEATKRLRSAAAYNPPRQLQNVWDENEQKEQETNAAVAAEIAAFSLASRRFQQAPKEGE